MSDSTPENPNVTATAAPAPAPERADRAQAAASRPARGARGKKSGPARKAPVREVHPLLQRLWELHPKLFGARFRPLKLGIFEDLMASHPGAFAKDDLKQALGQHVRSTRYLEAVAEGEPRCGLDGQPVEPVALEHVQHAILEVLRRRQARDPVKARAWARAQLVRALDASGLTREAYLERLPTRDALALELVEEAFAELSAQAARREALVRAYRTSGQASVEAFADMYGMDAALVRDALARSETATSAAAPTAAPSA